MAAESLFKSETRNLHLANYRDDSDFHRPRLPIHWKAVVGHEANWDPGEDISMGDAMQQL